jgi:hypothetical protein
MEKLLSPEEVADLLGLTLSKLSQDRFLGRGIPYIKLGKAVRYRPSDVESYVEASARLQESHQ